MTTIGLTEALYSAVTYTEATYTEAIIVHEYFDASLLLPGSVSVTIFDFVSTVLVTFVT